MSTGPDKFTGAARTIDPMRRARVAAFRFGLGAKKGTVARLGASINAAYDALESELQNPGAALLPVNLSPADDYQRCCATGGNDVDSAALVFEELGRRYAKHMEPDVGFVERLVLFWSNHFSMTLEKSIPVRATIGHFERTVIRPNVLGRYPDMLKAALTHPAMIVYLDNQASSAQAMNENLGRETLELYTLGTSKNFPLRKASYIQKDVVAMSAMLTGWTVNFGLSEKASPKGGRYGQFMFRQDLHIEKAQTIMGQTFSAAGQGKGLAALDWLALHPFTAEHIAFKLLRHFVCDQPTAAMVETLKSTFISSGGDLLAVSRKLVQMEEAWTMGPRIRPPHLWVVGQARGLGFTARDFGTTQETVLNRWQLRLATLNNAAWSWLTPDGFPDTDDEWIDPDAMRMRLMVANQILIDATDRGVQLPDATTLRGDLLPGSISMTDVSGLPSSVQNRAAIAALFLFSTYMTR